MYSPAKGHLGCFQVFVCYELAAIKQYVQVFKFFYYYFNRETEQGGEAEGERKSQSGSIPRSPMLGLISRP